MDRKDWNRVGLVAAVLLVPGGFLLGGALLARRAGKGTEPPTPAEDALPNPATSVIAGPDDHSDDVAKGEE